MDLKNSAVLSAAILSAVVFALSYAVAQTTSPSGQTQPPMPREEVIQRPRDPTKADTKAPSERAKCNYLACQGGSIYACARCKIQIEEDRERENKK
jgi:hypothetical protein